MRESLGLVDKHIRVGSISNRHPPGGDLDLDRDSGIHPSVSLRKLLPSLAKSPLDFNGGLAKLNSLCKIDHSLLYYTLSIYRGYIQHDDAHIDGKTLIRLCNNERHPKPRPYGRAMECLSLVVTKNDRDISRAHCICNRGGAGVPRLITRLMQSRSTPGLSTEFRATPPGQYLPGWPSPGDQVYTGDTGTPRSKVSNDHWAGIVSRPRCPNWGVSDGLWSFSLWKHACPGSVLISRPLGSCCQ